MSWPEGSRGERDASKPTLMMGQQKHLYLIFQDWELGYNIRELTLSTNSSVVAKHQQPLRLLPPPFIRLEARRGSPKFFAAVGTKILATHPRSCDFTLALAPGGILPMVDVRSRGLNFAPGELYPEDPIFLTVVSDDDDDLVFALDIGTFKMLSMKQLWPPRLEFENKDQITEWSWVDLPTPPTEFFQRTDVTSYAVGRSDDEHGQTVLIFSTAAATFSFDLQDHEWKKLLDWPLPFSGSAFYVRDLDVFVGLPPKDGQGDDDSGPGRICFCRWGLGDDDDDGDKRVWLSKENLSNKDLSKQDPAEDHLGTTLVYLGGSRFCLVECIRNGDADAVDEWCEKYLELAQAEKWEEIDQIVEREGCPQDTRCCLTTFSLSSDVNGDLTAAKTAVQCYKVPSEASCDVNPVAFWL